MFFCLLKTIQNHHNKKIRFCKDIYPTMDIHLSRIAEAKNKILYDVHVNKIELFRKEELRWKAWTAMEM